MSDKKAFPEHVAIILDGNGRWARERGRERTYGHQVGAANVKTIVRAAGHMGIKVLTLYAFSTENWKRPSLEVRFLMKLFKNYLISQLKELVEDNVQVHIVGDTSVLSEGLRKGIAECERDTAKNDGQRVPNMTAPFEEVLDVLLHSVIVRGRVGQIRRGSNCQIRDFNVHEWV